jgi:hypothetical protein
MTVIDNGSNTNRTVTVRRKATKRTLPFDLAAGELEASPQAEDILAARKKPRLDEPLPTTTDEAMTASPDVSVGPPMKLKP